MCDCDCKGCRDCCADDFLPRFLQYTAEQMRTFAARSKDSDKKNSWLRLAATQEKYFRQLEHDYKMLKLLDSGKRIQMVAK